MTDDRALLADSAREFLDRWSSSAEVRTWLSTGGPKDDRLWSKMAELGWPALLVPESHGGIGATLADAATIAEALGAHTAAVPFLSAAVLATTVLAAAQGDHGELLAQLAEGITMVTVAVDPGIANGYRTDGVTATPSGDGYTFDGTVTDVPDLVGADLLLVAAPVGDDDTVLALVPAGAPGVARADQELLDLTRRAGTLTLSGVSVGADDVLATGANAVLIARTALLRGQVILAADSVGAARRALSMAVDYSKYRVQFDRPIGSFQAVKHKLADMFALTEVAGAAVEQAATLAEEAPESRLVLSAASYAQEAAVRIVGDAIQVHGGIGFTWEHDCHMLLKRVLLNEAMLGTVQELRERIAAQLLAG
jgi:alkylation response protein AidB-like acyl-CoA dehydrogenase